MMPRSDPLSAPQSTQSPPSSTAIHDTATQAVTTPSASSSHAVRASHSQRTPSRHATPPPSLHLAQPTTTVVSSSSEGGHEAVSAHDDSTLRHSGPYRSHSSVMQRRQQPGSPVACTMSDSALHERHTHGPLVPPLMREGGDGGGSRSHSDTSSSSSEARHASTSRRSRMHNKETAADFVVETNEQQYDRHTTATTVYSSQDDARRTNSGGSETRHASRILMPHCPSPPPTTTTLLTTPSSQTQLLPPCQPSPPQPCSSSSAVVTDTLPPAATITSNSSNTRDVLPAVRCMTSTSSSSSLSQTTTMTRTTSASSRSAARMRHRLSSHTGSSGSGVSVGTSGVGNDPTTNIIGGVPMAGGMMRLPSTSASSSAELSPLPPMQLLPLTMATCTHDSNHNYITGDAAGGDSQGQQLQQQHYDREVHALQAAGPAAATMIATQHSTQLDSESHACTDEDNNRKKTGSAAAIVATGSTSPAVGSVHDIQAAGTAVRSSSSSSNSPPQAEQATNNNTTTTITTSKDDAEGEADKPRHAPRLSFKERLGAGCTGLPSRLTRGRTSLRATTTSTTTPTLTAVTTVMRNAGRSTPASPDISHTGQQTQTSAPMHTTTPSGSSPTTATNLYRGYNPSTLTRSSAVLATSPMTHPFTTSTASCMTQRPSQGNASPLQQQVETSEVANESSARNEAGKGDTQPFTTTTTSSSHTTASPATLCAQPHTVTSPALDVSRATTLATTTTAGEMATRGAAKHVLLQRQLCEEQPILQVDQLSADIPRTAELQTNSLNTISDNSVAAAERATSQSTCRYSQPSTPLAAPGTTCRSPRFMQTRNTTTTMSSTKGPSPGTALHATDTAAHINTTTTTSNANTTRTTKSHSPAWHATRATTDYISTTTTTPTLTPPPSGHHRLPSTNSAATHSPRMRPKRRVWRAQTNLTGAMHATGITSSSNIQSKDAGSRGASGVARTASGLVHDTHTAPLATTNSNAPLSSAHVSANASPLRQRRDRGKMLSRESSALLVSETLAMHARTASATSISASALADTVHLTDTLRSGGSTGSSGGGGNSARRQGQTHHPNDEDNNKERSSERSHTRHNNNDDDDDERRQHEGDMPHHSDVMGGSAMAARRVLFQSDSVNAECATLADTSRHDEPSPQQPLQAMPSSPQTVAATATETRTVTTPPHVVTTITATATERDTTMASSAVQQQPAAVVVGMTQSTFTPPTVATITTTTSPSALRHSPPCASPSVDEQHALPVDTSASTSNPSFSASSLSITATTMTTTAAAAVTTTTTGHADTTAGSTSHSMPPCHGSASYQASHSPTRQGREHSVVHTVPSLLPHDTQTTTTNSSSDEDKTGTHSRADLSSTPLQLDPHHHNNNNNDREDNNDDTLAHTTGSMRTMALLAGSHSLVSSFHLAGLGATSSGGAAAAAKKDNGRVSSFSSLQFSVRPRPRRRIVASERRHGTTTSSTITGHISAPTRTRRAHQAGTAVHGSSTGGGRGKEEEKETRRVTPSAATAQQTTTTTEEARKDRTARTDAMPVVVTTCSGGVGSAEGVAAHAAMADAPHTAYTTTATSHAHRDRSHPHKTTTTSSSSSSSASAAGHSQQRRPQTAATLPRAEHTSTTSHAHPTTTISTAAVEMPHADSDNDRSNYEGEERVSSDLDTLQQMAGDSLSASAIEELGMMSGDEAISGGADGSAIVGVGMRESVTHVFLPVYELLLEANDTASESTTTTTTVTANNSPRMSLRAESPFSPKSHSYSIEPTATTTTMTIQGTLGGNAMGGAMGTPALRGRASEGTALAASPASPPPVVTTTTSNSRPLSRQSPQHSPHNNNNDDDDDDTEAAALPSATDKSLLPMSAHGPTQSTKATTTTTAACGSPLPETAAAASPMYLPHSTASPPPMQSPPASSSLYSHHTCYYQALPPSALRPQASPYSTNATAGSPPSAQLARATTMNNTAARLTPASSPLHAAGPLQLGSVAASYYCEPSAEPDPAVDCKIAARFVFDPQRGVLLIDPCQEVCRYMAQSELSSSRRCAMSSCGPCATTTSTSNGKAATAPETDTHGGCSAACGDNVSKNEDEEEGDGACGCSADFIAKDVRGVDYSGYHAHELYDHCSLCQRRPAAFLCLHCLQAFCPSHVARHHAQDPANCTLFLNVLDILTCFQRIFWCEKCKRFTWRYTDVYEPLVDQIVYTRGTYLTRPVYDMHCIGFEAQLHDTNNYNNNRSGSNDNVHATTSQDPTSSNSFSPYVLPAAMSCCPVPVPVLVPSLNERVTATTMMTPGTPRALDCTMNNMNTSGEGNAVSSSSNGGAMLLPPSTALMHAMGSPRYHGTKEKEEEGQQEKESVSSPFTHAPQREQQHVVLALDAAHGTACEFAQTDEAQPVAGRPATTEHAVADTTTQAAARVVIVEEPNITTTGEAASGHATDNAQSQPTTTIMPAARQRSIALGDPVTRLSALSASMQGWRSTQEDAATAFLITLPSFTASSSPSQRTQAGQSVTAQTTTTATTSNGLCETTMMSPPHDTPSAAEAPASSQATQTHTTLSSTSDNEKNDACSPALASAPLPPVLSSSSAATSPLVMDETDGTPMAVFCVFDGHGGDAVAKLAAEHFEFHLSQAMRRVRPEDSAAQALLRSVRSDSLGPASVRTPSLQQQQQRQQEVTGRPLVSALNSDAVNNNNTTNVVVMGGAVAGRRGSVGSAVPSSAAASPMTLSTVYAASPTLTSTTTGTTTTTTNNAKDLLTPYVGSHQHHHTQQQQQTTMTPSPPTLLASATTTTTGSEAGMTSGGGGHAVHITSATAAAADRGSGAGAGLYGSFGSGRSAESGADFLAQSVPLQSNSPAKTDAVPTLDVSSTVQEHKGLSTPHITPSGIALLSDQTGSNTACPTYRQAVHSNSSGEAVKMPDTAEAGQTPPQTQSMMGLPHVLPISPEQRLRQHISTTTPSAIPHEVAHSHSPAALRQNTAPRLRLRPCPVVSDVGHNAVVSGSLSKSNSGSSFAGKAAYKDTLREEREKLQPQTSSPPRTFAVTHTSTPPIQPATSAITGESTRQPSSLGYLSCLSPPPSLSSSSSPLYLRNATHGQQQQHDEGDDDEGGEDERLRSHAHSPHPAIPSPPQLHTSHTTITTTNMRADGTRIATNTTTATAITPSPPLRATMTGSPAPLHHSRRQVPLLVQQPSSPSRVYVSAHEMTLLRDYFARIMTDALLSLDAFLQHTVEGERGDYGCVGCTACVVGITSHFILCANVGDSGAALYTPETIEMISVTQRVNQPKERSRILQAGYAIIEDRIEGLLAVPRALGDFDFKQCGGKTAAEQAVTAVPEVTIRPVPLHRTSAQPLPHSFSSSSSLPPAAATKERGGKGRHAEGSPDTMYNDNMGYYSNNNMNVYNSQASGSNECEYGKWGVLVACDGVWDTATLHQVHYALTHTTNELDVASSATAAVLRGRECLREGLYCHDMPDNDTTAGAARQSPSHTAQSPPPLPSKISFAARHTPDMPTKPQQPTTTVPVRGSGEDERHAPTTATTSDVVRADRQTVTCPTQLASTATLVTDNSNAVAALTGHDEVSRSTQPMSYTSVVDNNSHHSGSSAWHTPVLQRTQSSASPHAGPLGGAVEQAHTLLTQQQQSVTEGLQRLRSGRMGSCAEAECGIDARLLTAAAGVFAQCIAPADNDEGIGLDNCSLILIERRA